MRRASGDVTFHQVEIPRFLTRSIVERDGAQDDLSNSGAYHSTLFINTPLTADKRGNGFQVTGNNPSGLGGGAVRLPTRSPLLDPNDGMIDPDLRHLRHARVPTAVAGRPMTTSPPT